MMYLRHILLVTGIVSLLCINSTAFSAAAPTAQKPQASEAAEAPLTKGDGATGDKDNQAATFKGLPFFLSLVILAVVYFGVVRIVPLNSSGKYRVNPVALTAGAFGRGSVSNLQIFVFSLTVFWLLLYQLFARGELQELPQDVLILLGVSAAGAAGGKVTAVTRKRLAFENWSWLKRKKWIVNSIEKPGKPASLSDLVTSDEAFDVYKFQMLAFSIVVGVALIKTGMTSSLADFKIGANLLGILGISQGVYVGGKAIGPATNADLDKAITKVRELETKFIAVVAEAWKTGGPKRNVSPEEDAIRKAPKEYNEYIEAANGAAVMVQERIGAAYPTENTAPSLPSIRVASKTQESGAKG